MEPVKSHKRTNRANNREVRHIMQGENSRLLSGGFSSSFGFGGVPDPRGPGEAGSRAGSTEPLNLYGSCPSIIPPKGKKRGTKRSGVYLLTFPCLPDEGALCKSPAEGG